MPYIQGVSGVYLADFWVSSVRVFGVVSIRRLKPALRNVS